MYKSLDSRRLAVTHSCPLCQGRPTLDSRTSRWDPPCVMCGGNGVISDETCPCGRPIVWKHDKWYSCNDVACMSVAFKRAREDQDAELQRARKTVG